MLYPTEKKQKRIKKARQKGVSIKKFRIFVSHPPLVRACSSHKEPKALLNSRHELQARPTAL